MAAAIGFWNPSSGAGNAVNGVKPMDSATGKAASSSSSGADAGTITSNDFLTLLVTEMKNQDPTANTDPNQYINQLVQVNSLQQLISINQVLTADSSVPTSGQAVAGPISGAGATASAAEAGSAVAVHSTGVRTTSGNLSVPDAKPAAHRVAQALSGQH